MSEPNNQNIGWGHFVFWLCKHARSGRTYLLKSYANSVAPNYFGSQQPHSRIDWVGPRGPENTWAGNVKANEM